MDRHSQHKANIAPLRHVMAEFETEALRAQFKALCVPDVVFRLAFPFKTVTGVDAYVDTAYAPLARAVPDLERRDYIVMAGPTPEGADWVGCAGYYTGTFIAPWLNIPPTPSTRPVLVTS